LLASESAFAPSPGGSDLVRSGAELVELSERFYRGIFLGVVGFVGLSAVAALVLLPLRAGSSGPPILGLVLPGLMVAATPLAIWHRRALYLALRRHPRLELVAVVVSAALVSAVFPLHSQLWWPSCALLMLLGVIAPLQRVLGYCLIVLASNLLAHLLSGDLDHTPAVAIIGLWIGYPFWSCTVAAITGQMASQLLRLNTSAAARRLPPRRVAASVPAHTDAAEHVQTNDHGAESDAADLVVPKAADNTGPRTARPTTVQRLTARQLQVVALLADGLRYREVADCLGVTERQVQRHVAEAIERADARTAGALVALAVADGLVPRRASTEPAEPTTTSIGVEL
jgi:DNA-binding CsgD family transcriptional regulator